MYLSIEDRKSLSGRVFKEPLSDATIRKRTNLLFVSSFAILLAVYDLKITSTPWLNIEVPVNTPALLHGAIAVALAYTFLVYCLYVIEDLRRWKQAASLMRLQNYFEMSQKSNNYLHTIEQYVERIGNLNITESKAIGLQKAAIEAKTFLEHVDEKVRYAERDHKTLGLLQYFRLFVLDIGIPVALGAIALVKIGPALVPFVNSVFA